jgi:hypothetical protein
MVIYVKLEENHQMPSYESSVGLFEHPEILFQPNSLMVSFITYCAPYMIHSQIEEAVQGELEIIRAANADLETAARKTEGRIQEIHVRSR